MSETVTTGCPHCQTWGDHQLLARPNASIDGPNSAPNAAFRCALCRERFDSWTDLSEDECERYIPNQ
jgi:hypothetical protein